MAVKCARIFLAVVPYLLGVGCAHHTVLSTGEHSPRVLRAGRHLWIQPGGAITNTAPNTFTIHRYR